MNQKKNRTPYPWNYITAKAGGRLEGKDMDSANSHVATTYLQKMKEKLLLNLISILN